MTSAGRSIAAHKIISFHHRDYPQIPMNISLVMTAIRVRVASPTSPATSRYPGAGGRSPIQSPSQA